MKPTLLVIATAVLHAPTAASAATTYTVGPGQSVRAAIDGAGDGDTVHVLPGTYVEQPITVAHAIRVEGEPGTTVTTTDPSSPLLTITQGGAALDGLLLSRTSGGDASVVDVTATTGTTTISHDLIVNATGATGHTSPAVLGGAGSSLAISDTLIVSGAGEGPALRLVGGAANSLVRSSVAAIASGQDAVQVQSTDSGAKQLAIDSSILSGGASAASLRATTSKGLLNPTGDIAISAVHATIAGAAAAVATLADSSGVGIGSPGAISVSADRSILRGTISGGTAVTSSDASGADVFVNAGAKNFHLRADAPAIDQGGPLAAGESDRDVDGQPRVAGAASDLGADEFVNQAPVARLAAPAAVKTPGATSFDASASADPEAGSGGGIAGYHFDFGDGTSADSPTPAVTHVYTRPGTFAATVTVTDAQGLAGAPSDPVQALVADGIAPSARIISPRNGRKLRLITRRHRRAPIRFTGSASDESGIAAVGLTLRRIGTKKLTNIRVRVQQGIWSYRVPKRLKLKRGRYELKAYAVDTAGNVSKAARARFTLK